jgi:hypothetical protein
MSLLSHDVTQKGEFLPKRSVASEVRPEGKIYAKSSLAKYKESIM